MIENAVKTLLGKELYKKVKEENLNTKKLLSIYHYRCGRDKEKFRKEVERILEQKNSKEKREIIKTIERAIELHKKKIEVLEKMKEGVVYL